MKRQHLLKDDTTNIGYWKIANLICIIAWDNLAKTLIALLFSKSRFLNVSNLYKYTYTLYCIYNVYSGILMPNFAMQKAFQNKIGILKMEENQELAKYLIDGIYINFKILIFSATHFKILHPYLIQK